MLNSKPSSIKKFHMHAFSTASEETGTPSTNDILFPNAFPEAKALTFDQKEIIYHASRGHDGCYKALDLSQAFFALFHILQMVSIQIKKEEPGLVAAFMCQILEFNLKGPKQSVIATGMKGVDGISTIITDLEQESVHSVLAFPVPGGSEAHYVVDMCSMQFGESGRGSFGELYFLGTMGKYLESMKVFVKVLSISLL